MGPQWWHINHCLFNHCPDLTSKNMVKIATIDCGMHQWSL